MHKKYRILHIFSGYGGGVSSLVRNLIENKSEDYIFDTMTFSYENGESYVEAIESMGGRCLLMPRIRNKGLLSFFSFLNRTISNTYYDAVHCHLSGLSAFPFVSLAKFKRIKYVIIHAHSTVHDSWWDRVTVLFSIGKRINYCFSDCFLTCSDLAAQYVFGEKYLKTRPALLIPNGIAYSKFNRVLSEQQRSQLREEIGSATNTLVILHIGRFNKQKNHEFLINIAQILRSEGVDFKLLLVGVGEKLSEVQAQISKLDLERNVLFLKRRTDITELMQFSDCMLLPSFNEGLPTVAIECQASGTNMILSSEITRQCDMGIGLLSFLPIDNPSAWVKQICQKWSHADVFACLEKIKDNGFTAETSGKRYCNFLSDNIDSRKVM